MEHFLLSMLVPPLARASQYSELVNAYYSILAGCSAVQLLTATAAAQSPAQASSPSVAPQQQFESPQAPADPMQSRALDGSRQYELRWTQPVAEGTPRATEITEWYGWQNLLSDAVSVALIAQGGSTNSNALAYVGVAGYMVGSPVIHAAHGSVTKPFVSLALRLGLPALGGLSVALLSKRQPDDEGNDIGYALGIAGGVVVGALTAALIDDIAVARKVTKVTPTAAARPRLYLSPIIAKDVRGVSLGLSM
jgi:hypothetical protein